MPSLSVAYMSLEELQRLARSHGMTNPVLCVEGKGQLLLGGGPGFFSHLVDMKNDRLVGLTGRSEAPPAFAAPVEEEASGRRSGVYAVELLGESQAYHNLRSLLTGTVQAVAARDASFLERLSQEKGRTRRLVASSPEGLFDRPHLARQHAAPLDNGWYINTNNSKEQVVRWLQIICRVANLQPQCDLKWSI